MKICKNCGDEFPSLSKDVNGKRIDSRRREYCLKCNPLGERNFWRGKKVEKRKRTSKVERICKECGKTFNNVSRNLICTTCKNRKTRLERKAEAYRILCGKCKNCGYDKCIDAMDIHHLEKERKLFTFAGSWGLAWDKIEKELDKCILLCSNCHRELHAGFIKI